jgi:hypothetical protein
VEGTKGYLVFPCFFLLFLPFSFAVAAAELKEIQKRGDILLTGQRDNSRPLSSVFCASLLENCRLEMTWLQRVAQIWWATFQVLQATVGGES